MTTRFDAPPINELVIATYFNPPISNFLNQHVGLYWSCIREEYPTVEQKAPIRITADLQGSGEIFPMPRYWFVSSKENHLIQIQKNLFILNWRRFGEEYPHFDDSLKPEFDKQFGIFETFARKELSHSELRIQACELTYTNVVESGEYWSSNAQTKGVINNFNTPTIDISTIEDPSFNCVYVYKTQDDLQLQVSVRSAETADDAKQPVLVFEIKATGNLTKGSKSDADDWFQNAHDTVLRCFEGITSEKVRHTYWKQRGPV